MKRLAIATVLLFLLPLVCLGFLSLTGDAPTVSLAENRTLAPMPSFSWEALAAGTYTRALEEHYADTFPLREQLLGTSRLWDRLLTIDTGTFVLEKEFSLGAGESLEDIERAQGLTSAPPVASASPRPVPSPSPTPRGSPASPSPSVSPPTSAPTPTPSLPAAADVASGGYLLVGDRIMHMSKASEEQQQKYAGLINSFAEQLGSRRMISMVVPNSFPFYAPADYVDGDRDQARMIETLYALYDNDVVTVDAYTPISRHTDEYLYFRSDHHWNGRGAYWAYTGFCSALGFDPVPLEELESGQYEGFLGSFYRDMSGYPQSDAVKNNPDTVEYFLPKVTHSAEVFSSPGLTGGTSLPVVNTNLGADVSNKYICFTNGDQPLIRIRTDVPGHRKLLVIKESYGNALIPYLIHHFSEVYVIDYRRFNQNGDQPTLKLADFAEACGITDVMLVNYPYVPNASVLIDPIAKLLK